MGWEIKDYLAVWGGILATAHAGYSAAKAYGGRLRLTSAYISTPVDGGTRFDIDVVNHSAQGINVAGWKLYWESRNSVRMSVASGFLDTPALRAPVSPGGRFSLVAIQTDRYEGQKYCHLILSLTVMGKGQRTVDVIRRPRLSISERWKMREALRRIQMRIAEQGD